MRIETVETRVLRVPIRRAIADSMQHFTHFELPAVHLRTSTGIEGTGYSFTVGSGGSTIVHCIESLFSGALVGQDPWNVRRIWLDLFFGPSHWIGRSGVTAMAQAAVDLALWDIIAKDAGRPLWQVLGGCTPGDFLTYNTDAGWLNQDIDSLANEMMALVDAGYTAVKMKVGGPDWHEDVRRVAAVREAIGPTITLMVDANQRWDRHTALQCGRALERYDLAWLEEPLDPDDVHGHAILRSKLAIPIALGEHVYTTQAFRDFIAADAVDIVQVDVTRVGGITPALEVAAVANSYGLRVCPHAGDMMQVHQHLVRTIPSAWMLEVIPDWAECVFADRIVMHPGRCEAPQKPGASTDFCEDAKKQYTVKP